MTLPKFILELQDRENRDRCLQAIRTRYLLTLDELDKVRPPALVSLAVRIGRTRLIDNVVVG
jgi:pantothenate synthetase